MKSYPNSLNRRHPVSGAGRFARSAGTFVSCTLRALLVFLLVLCTTGNAPAIFAQGDDLTEYHIKAAILYNIAKFVQWPAGQLGNTETPFHLCVIGTEPFISMRETLAGKQIKGHKVMVRQIDSVETASDCQMLFVSAADSGATGPLPMNSGEPILSVGETADFIDQGGIINLATINNKVRFEINLMAGERLGFRFSAQLLKLAILVRTPDGRRM